MNLATGAVDLLLQDTSFISSNRANNVLIFSDLFWFYFFCSNCVCEVEEEKQTG